MISPLDILLIEDNLADVVLTEEAFAAGGVDHRLRVANDGDAALDLLRRAAGEDDLPDLVLLDVNLPGRTGHEVLSAIKADGALGRLPVLMLSSSALDTDVRRSYELHSSCYVTKPSDLDGYLDTVAAVERFWSATVELPGRRR